MVDLAQGLQLLSCNLETLKISFKWFTPFILTEDPTGPHWKNWQRLAEGIAANSTLQEVEIMFDSDIMGFAHNQPTSKLGDFMHLLAGKLSENKQTKVKKLTIGPCDQFVGDHSSREVVKAFTSLLETNTTLESMDIDLQSSGYILEELDYFQLDDEICMYLKLNKNGRGRFMEMPDKIPMEEWTSLFAKLNDTKCINYYLTRFPWLVNTGFEIVEEEEW